jgi:hypothetical protein
VVNLDNMFVIREKALEKHKEMIEEQLIKGRYG